MPCGCWFVACLFLFCCFSLVVVSIAFAVVLLNVCGFVRFVGVF